MKRVVAGQQRVCSEFPTEAVVSIAATDQITSRSPQQIVGAGFAIQRIAAFLTLERVVTATPVQRISKRCSFERIVPTSTVQRHRPVKSRDEERVCRYPTGQLGLFERIDYVLHSAVERSTAQREVVVACFNKSIRSGSAQKIVCSTVSSQMVVARFTEQNIRELSANQRVVTVAARQCHCTSTGRRVEHVVS